MEIKTGNYYTMTVKKGSVATYMYTGDNLPEGQYNVHIRGILRNSDKQIHTIVASAIPDMNLKKFNQYENVVAISVTEETPQFTESSLNVSCLHRLCQGNKS